MKIELLGTGCPKCNLFEQNLKKAISELGLKAKVIKINSIDEIINKGVMMTPSLFIDNKEVCSGRVPSVNEIIEWLK
ncbi:MAG: thioredoxin family protein [Candidatus Nanoarchaeia archaeon]|jgi:small redox-active disulfide protein 2